MKLSRFGRQALVIVAASMPFLIQAQPVPPVVPPLAPPLAPPPPPRADGGTCTALIQRISTRNEGRQQRRVLFNSAGGMCALDYPIRQGDLVQAFLVLRAGEDQPEQLPTVTVTNCTAPTGNVVVVGTIPAGIINQSGSAPAASNRPKVSIDTASPIGAPFECASAEPKVTVQPATGAAVETPLRFFSLTTATLHVGVMNSNLRDPDFGLRSVGGRTVLTDKEVNGRGPEYVASIVVQGFPNYFIEGLNYPGRDRVHDNSWKDRLGLAFNFGLKNPGKRFGMGLAFEVVRGVNVMAVHEWANQRRLDGIALGDEFTGEATAIPTTRKWVKGWSFGVSFDTDYLTGIFKSGS